MPTNFPTSVDNFTNPTANDSLNLPSHSTQHANANDAIEAVESYLLNGGQGLTLIKSQTLSGGSSVTITDVFSATYDAYRIVFTGLTTNTATGIAMQMGTNNTGYYSNQLVTTNYSAAGGTITVQNQNNQASYDLGIVATASPNATGGYVELQNPFAATTTAIEAFGTDVRTTDRGLRFNAGFHSVASSFTSFTVINSSVTFTGGRISVYGYGKGA
jgi:hypothetical protein